ncbi:hypothetical protein ACKWTF_014953 [Chironomus riparius]
MLGKISDFFKSMTKIEPNEKSKSIIEQEVIEISDSSSETEQNFTKRKPKRQSSNKKIEGKSFKNEKRCDEKVEKNIKNEPEREFVIEIHTKLPKLHQSSSTLNQNSATSPKKTTKSPKNSTENLKKPKKNQKYEKISKFLSENVNDCKFCDKRFTNKGYIYDHLRRVHSDKIKECLFKCTLCHQSFFHEYYLDMHLKTKHKNGKVESFMCDYDAKTFKKKNSLRLHMRSHLQKISCKICKAKLNVVSFRMHMTTHDSSKNFKCKTCDKSFRSNRHLTEHEQTHDKKFECSICNKKYAIKKQIRRHYKHFHQDQKTEICEICGKKFADKPNLKQHVPTHDKNRPKPFKCDKCGHATTTMQRIQNHMKRHENENKRLAALVNPKKCNICGKYFKDNFAVYAHRLSVHTAIKHQCDLCGNYYKSRNSLPYHMRFNHLNKKEVKS